MSKLDNFWQIRFFESVIGNAQYVITDSTQKPPSDRKELVEWRKGTRARMSGAERYYVDVFYRVMNLNHVLDRLKQARYLIARSPGSYRNRAFSINRNDWSDYHFYVYTTSLASVLDCALLITAEVFKLGLPPRHCTFDIVTQHDWLAGSQVPRTLRSLKKTLEQHIHRRHRYVHRGEESNFDDLTDPDDLLRLRTITFLADRGNHLIPRQTLSWLWKLQIKEVRENFNEIEEKVLQKASDVLECLLPIYEHNVNIYKPRSVRETEGNPTQ